MMRYLINKIKTKIEFLGNLLVRAPIDFIWIFTLISLWSFFGYMESIEYFLLANLIAYVSFSWEILDIADKWVREGKLTLYLLYPKNLLKFIFFEALGERFLYSLSISFPLFLILIFKYNVNLLLILVSITFVFFYTFFFYLQFFYLSLKTEGAKPIFSIFHSIFKWMLSGASIPVELLNKYFPLYKFLPFKYFSGFVWELLKNPLTIIPGIFWLFLFLVISTKLYRKALKHYTGYNI